jgi:proline iminopeptidase
MLYPPIEPFSQGMLPLDGLHQMYWEQCGAPDGQPVLYLHGGPGDGCAPLSRQLFDPLHYRAVLFDQRGSGRSVPRGEWRDNTTAHLIADIERLREHLGIERWLLFGGSWGSTLALVYAQAHPERVTGLVLRGIFLGRQSEIDWFMQGMGQFHPEAWQAFVAPIPPAERGQLLQAYYRRLCDPDPQVHLPLARSWGRYEASCVALRPHPDTMLRAGSEYLALPLARLEAHYFIHRIFLPEGQLLQQIPRIRYLPAIIVQGRHDLICPPASAYELARHWPEAEFQLVEAAGHSLWEEGILQRLLQALERCKQLPR